MTAIHMDINPNSIRAALAGIGNRAPQKTVLEEIFGERAANRVASLGAFWDRRSAHINNGGSVGPFLKKEACGFASGLVKAKAAECAIQSTVDDVKAVKGLGDFACKFFTRRDMAGLGRFITGR